MANPLARLVAAFGHSALYTKAVALAATAIISSCLDASGLTRRLGHPRWSGSSFCPKGGGNRSRLTIIVTCMIVLQAIRLDAHDRFQYRIENEDAPPLLVGDPREAVERLRECGVSNPEQLIEHVKTWGIIEILPG